MKTSQSRNLNGLTRKAIFSYFHRLNREISESNNISVVPTDIINAMLLTLEENPQILALCLSDNNDDRELPVMIITTALSEFNLEQINRFKALIPDKAFSLTLMHNDIVFVLNKRFIFKDSIQNGSAVIAFLEHAFSLGLCINRRNIRDITTTIVGHATKFTSSQHKDEMLFINYIIETVRKQGVEVEHIMADPYKPFYPKRIVQNIRNNIGKYNRANRLYKDLEFILTCTEVELSILLNNCHTAKYNANASVLTFLMNTRSLTAMDAMSIEGVNDTIKAMLLTKLNG